MPAYVSTETTPDPRYYARIAAALDRVLRETSATPARRLEVSTARYVIVSDQHKGARNGADDFRRCERAYNAALAYYHAAGYHLVELGDVEELWEERAGVVVKQYRHSLALSARFQRDGRYTRVWGNHDDAWNASDSVRRWLGPIYGAALEVHEGVRLEVYDGQTRLGQMLLVHGHQGTGASDRWNRLARIPVRWIWRPFQRLTKISLNTPAKDWKLRQRHNLALHYWAAHQDQLVLIAGHTHVPVFLSQSRSAQLQELLESAQRALAGDPQNSALQLAVAEVSADLEWARAQGEGRTGPEGAQPERTDCPCYFNTGCCSFLDGDITGIEIADGEIRLVRWPDDRDQARPQVLAAMPIADLFAQLTPRRAAVAAVR